MASVADVIRQHHSEIVALWKREAGNAASARGLSSPEFRNVMPTYLRSLAEQPDSPAEQAKHIENHLGTRVRQGFDLAEIQEEFLILGHCVARFWEGLPQDAQPASADLERFHTNLQFASLSVAQLYQEHMQFDEQHEKRYLRLLQSIADAALRNEREPLTERLREVVELVIEATGAQAAAILLFHAETQELVTLATAGIASDELRRLVADVSPTSFHGAVASSEEPTQVKDAETTELEVSDALRRSGIHALLGTRLPPHHELVGIMYVGVTEKRAFSASEARRLEALGDKLTLHLENARLYADLRKRIAELDQERGLRERFVSILAHDLRGPLSTATMSAHFLSGHPQLFERGRGVAFRIEKVLGRMDAMIRDMLDVSRIRAGQRLPLRLEDCDLGAVAEQAVEEARAAQGDGRFVLQVDGQVRGVWSGDDLRRAVWNLATNGLKYGAADRPVVIRVERTQGGARVSVHNDGNPIPARDQARIFEAFERQTEERERVGWGLGLTLVRACAEAHGGKVTLSSAPGDGTTFAIELPSDSRPFLAAGWPNLAPEHQGASP